MEITPPREAVVGPEGAERFTGAPGGGEAGYQAQALSGTGETSRLSTYILYTLCHLSEPQFSHLSEGHNYSTDRTGLSEV